MAANNNGRAGKLLHQPNPKLRVLNRLVGAWRMYGEEVEGTQAHEWMEGQRVRLPPSLPADNPRFPLGA